MPDERDLRDEAGRVPFHEEGEGKVRRPAGGEDQCAIEGARLACSHAAEIEAQAPIGREDRDGGVCDRLAGRRIQYQCCGRSGLDLKCGSRRR